MVSCEFCKGRNSSSSITCPLENIIRNRKDYVNLKTYFFWSISCLQTRQGQTRENVLFLRCYSVCLILCRTIKSLNASTPYWLKFIIKLLPTRLSFVINWWLSFRVKCEQFHSRLATRSVKFKIAGRPTVSGFTV